MFLEVRQNLQIRPNTTRHQAATARAMETRDAAQGLHASAHDACVEDAVDALLSMQSQVVPTRNSQPVGTSSAPAVSGSTAQSALSPVTSAPPQGALATLYAGRKMEQEPNKSTPARFETTSGRAQERKRDKLADQSSVFDKSFTERLAKLKSLFCGIHSDLSASSSPRFRHFLPRRASHQRRRQRRIRPARPLDHS